MVETLMFDGHERPMRAPGAVASEVLDELVVYSPANSQALSLNESARAIWELCDGERTLDDICAELADSVGLPPVELRDDVRNAVSQLHALGVVDLAA